MLQCQPVDDSEAFMWVTMRNWRPAQKLAPELQEDELSPQVRTCWDSADSSHHPTTASKH